MAQRNQYLFSTKCTPERTRKRRRAEKRNRNQVQVNISMSTDSSSDDDGHSSQQLSEEANPETVQETSKVTKRMHLQPQQETAVEIENRTENRQHGNNVDPDRHDLMEVDQQGSQVASDSVEESDCVNSSSDDDSDDSSNDFDTDDDNDDGGGGDSSGGDSSGGDSDDDDSDENDIYIQGEDDTFQDPFNLKHRQNQRVAPGCLTFTETLCLLVAFIFKHALSYSAVVDLFVLLNMIFSFNSFPTTKHTIKRMIHRSTNSFSFYMYCTDCKIYLGRVTKSRKRFCNSCNTWVPFSLKNQNYFAIPNIPKLIKNTLERQDIKSKIINETSQNLNSFSDVQDGSLHRELCRKFGNIFTYNIFFDSAAMFKSAKSSLTCILLSLNCIPVPERFKTILIGGMWYGKNAVDVSIFFTPFVKWAQYMTEMGVRYTNAAGVVVTNKFYPLCCIADTVARHKWQNMTAFNGKFGCSWCHHPNMLLGQRANKYIMSCGPLPALRSHASWIRDATEAVRVGHDIHGVHGKCILSLIAGFSMLSFLSELLHGGYYGPARFISMVLWFGKAREPYYIGTPAKINKINRRLQLMQLPHTTDTRSVTNINQRGHWHASDWKWWLFYLSIPSLLGVLPKIYLHHWSFLVKAIYLLNKNKVSNEDIAVAQELLLKYVWGMQIMYGQSFMTFNNHQLLHLPTSVVRGGPLWAYTAFPFESYFSTVKKFVTGSGGVTHQVVERLCALNCLQNSMLTNIQNPSVLNFCSTAFHCKNNNPIDVAKTYGRSRPHQQLDNVNLHDKFIYRKNVYRTHGSQEGKNNYDACIQLLDGQFAIIHEIRHLIDPAQNIVENIVIQIEFLDTQSIMFSRSERDNFVMDEIELDHIFVASRSDEFVTIIPTDIARKCIFLKGEDRNYICLCVNTFEVQ